MMKLKDIKDKNIVRVFSDSDKYGRGDRVILLLEGKIGILINSFWASYFEFKDIQKLNLQSFNRLEISDEPLILESIYTIEGVATYIKLSGSYFIYLYEEIEDMERFAYYNKIKILCSSSQDTEEYQEILEDIKEAEEMILAKIDSIDKELT